jgi:hypothetical protein
MLINVEYLLNDLGSEKATPAKRPRKVSAVGVGRGAASKKTKEAQTQGASVGANTNNIQVNMLYGEHINFGRGSKSTSC